jgi:hypothetical protein
MVRCALAIVLLLGCTSAEAQCIGGMCSVPGGFSYQFAQPSFSYSYQFAQPVPTISYEIQQPNVFFSSVQTVPTAVIGLADSLPLYYAVQPLRAPYIEHKIRIRSRSRLRY